MSNLFFTVTLTDLNRGLAVSLADPCQHPGHERLAALQHAVNDWRQRDPDRQLRKETVASVPEGCIPMDLQAYLYGDGTFNAARLGRHLDQVRAHGTIHRFTIRPGSPVEGLDLFARDAAIAALRDAVCAGRSCHLRAPRRYGKTSVLRGVDAACTERRRPSIMVDVSAGETALWLFVTVAAAAMDRSDARPFLSALPELAGWPPVEAPPLLRSEARKRLAEDVAGRWENFGRRLMETLADAGAVLILDEFSVYLRAAREANPDEAHAVTRLLQAARIRTPALAQILAGSAGLGAYILFLGMDREFVDLDAVDLPPLDPAAGRELAEELLYGLNLSPTPETVDAVLTEIGAPVPYFIHVLADAIGGEAGEVGVVTPAIVRRAYRERVLGPWANSAFRPYRLAAQPYPAKLRHAAGRVLQALARASDPVPRPQLVEAFGQVEDFDAVLACLQEDYDLVATGEAWEMRSKVLRDRWALAEAWLTHEGAE